MKKFLSLVLTLVMTMSLVTVSAGAKDFTDADTINYDEAIAVISEIGVVDGYTDGKFNPQNNLTRQAAAKIICNLILGPTTAKELNATTAPFKDVPVTSEFAGYITYCAKRGIISGYADGNFRPGNPLTGYAFMKMLLGALGYDAEQEQYIGANWSIQVAKQAKGIGLDKGLIDEFNGTKTVNREEACLYAFNTLQATLVEYKEKTTLISGSNMVLETKVPFSEVNWGTAEVKNDGNIDSDGHVQFAEKYFSKLVKNGNTSDDFERPAHTWTYDKREIGTWVDSDKLVESYTKGVSGRDLYDLLTSAVIKDNDLVYYVDGALAKDHTSSEYNGDDVDDIEKKDLVRSNKDDVGMTGNGVVTEVYLDTDKDLITIVSINTWLAQAAGNYNEKSETISLKVATGYTAGAKTSWTTKIVDLEDIDLISELSKDDFVLVNMTKKDRQAMEPVQAALPEIMEDVTVTAFSKDKKDTSSANGSNAVEIVTSLTTGGEEYKANDRLAYDAEVLNEYNIDQLKDNSYTVYVDANGYMLGVDLYEGTKNYVFITGYDRGTSHISVKTADAAAIFLDGTMKQIKVNVTDTDKNIAKAKNTVYFDRTAGQWSANSGGKVNENRWYTYTVDSDGTYTLNPCERQLTTAYVDVPGYSAVASANDPIINCNHVNLKDELVSGNNAYGEDDSVYITVEQDKVDESTTKCAITDVNGVYTGVQEIKINVEQPTEEDGIDVNPVYAVYDGDHFVIGAVVIGEAQGNTKNYAYVLSGAKSESVDSDGYTYWTFDAILGGEVQKLTIKDKFSKTISNLKTKTVQSLTFDGDYVTKIDDVKDDKIVKAINTPINEKVHEVYDVTIPDGTAASFGKIPANADANSSTATTESRDLYLSGRTLYLSNTQGTPGQGNAVGLTFARDAKVVLIQRENNKNDVKTECASIEEAYGKLMDANTGLDGVQFRGRIVAVLDEYGVASYAVLISSTPIIAGTQAGPGDETSTTYGTAKVTDVNERNGRFTVQFDIKRPNYFADGTAVTATFDVYEDGYVVYSGLTQVVGGTDKATYLSPMGTVVDPDAKISAKITSLKPSAVKVRYKDVDANKYLTPGTLKDGTTSWTTTLTTDTSANADIKFCIKSNDGVTTFGTNELSANVNTTVAAKAGLTAGNDVTMSPKYATGTGYVTVEITGLSGLQTLYTVTGIASNTLGNLYAGTPDELKDLKLEVTASRTAVEANGATKLTIGSDSTSITGVNNYGAKVTLSTGKVVYFKNDGVAVSDTETITITADTTITVTKVEKVAAPTVTGVVVNDLDATGTYTQNDTIVVTFNEKLSAAPALSVSGTGSISIAAGTLSSDGMSVTYTLGTVTTAVVVNDKFELDGEGVSDATGVKNVKGFEATITALTPATGLTFAEKA